MAHQPSLGPAVRQGLVDDQNREEKHDRLVRYGMISCGGGRRILLRSLTVEQERQGLADSPRQKLNHGDDEQGDLDRGSDGDRDREVELVLDRDGNGGEMLGGVANLVSVSLALRRSQKEVSQWAEESVRPIQPRGWGLKRQDR